MIHWNLPLLTWHGGKGAASTWFIVLFIPIYTIGSSSYLFLLACGATIAPSSTTSKGAKLFSSQAICSSMSSSFGISSNWNSLGLVWVDLTICGSGYVRCCSSLLVKEGDGVLEVVLPYLKLPIQHSSFKSLSTLNMVASSKIGDLGSGACLCLPSIEGMFPLRGGLRGKCAYLSCCTLLPIVIV